MGTLAIKKPLESRDEVSAQLYRARRDVQFIDVPELGYAYVDGEGAPEGPAFQAALSGLFTVSYTAHFALRHEGRPVARVMPLEALWSLTDEATDILERVASGEANMAETDTTQWAWRALIMQPDPIGAEDIAQAIAAQRHRHPEVEHVRYERWREGLVAQILHVGPYSAESPTIVRLHTGLREAGYVPRGQHHEIYLGDPRRCAPERLRTILRQPVSLA